MSSVDRYDEAERLFTICNACRYCEGHCAVFPAMERRLTFAAPDIDYLANLCHNCGSCFHHCQYAPPHEFDVNLPALLQDIREDNYEQYIWPRFLALTLSRNLLWTVATLSVLCVIFLGSALATSGSGEFFSPRGADFYDIIGHRTMVTLFGCAAILVLVSLSVSMVRYWRAIGLRRVGPGHAGAGLAAALTLRNLDGGAGEGCTWPREAPSESRRVFHHLVFHGFILCFAATVTGTIYHYGLGRPAPYALISLPKILGTLGGIGIVVGTIGLLWLRRMTQPDRQDRRGLGASLILLLLVTALSGLLLMVMRETRWLGLMLCLHLASVLALFIAMPCGKFVHGLYRLIALIGFEAERGEDRQG